MGKKLHASWKMKCIIKLVATTWTRWTGRLDLDPRAPPLFFFFFSFFPPSPSLFWPWRYMIQPQKMRPSPPPNRQRTTTNVFSFFQPPPPPASSASNGQMRTQRRLVQSTLDMYFCDKFFLLLRVAKNSFEYSKLLIIVSFGKLVCFVARL